MHNIDRLIKIAITHGDINGIGYELILKTFAEPEILETFTPILYGSEKVLNYYSNLLGIRCQYNVVEDAGQAADGVLNLVQCIATNIKAEPGKEAKESAVYARQSVECAMRDYSNGLFDAMVVAPGSKEEIDSSVPVYAFDKICVASVLGGVQPSEDISFAKEDVMSKATMMYNALRANFRYDNPRIALLAYNEKITAEEDSLEMTSIAPAVSDLVKSGVQAFGPYTKDEFLGKNDWMHFDGVLAMYESQALQPIIDLYGDDAVVLYSGMDLVITSVMQGAMHDIAGKGMADEGMFRKAMYVAVDAFRNAYCHKLPYANPLPKLYHERKEDGEKVRFAVKRKEA